MKRRRLVVLGVVIVTVLAAIDVLMALLVTLSMILLYKYLVSARLVIPEGSIQVAMFGAGLSTFMTYYFVTTTSSFVWILAIALFVALLIKWYTISTDEYIMLYAEHNTFENENLPAEKGILTH